MMAEWEQLFSTPLRTEISYEPGWIDDIKYHKICVIRLELAIEFYEQKILHPQPQTGYQFLPDQLLTTITRYRAALVCQRARLQTLLD